MSKKVEDVIKNAFDNCTPDIFDKIEKDCQMLKGADVTMNNEKKNNDVANDKVIDISVNKQRRMNYVKILGTIVAVFVIVIGLIGYFNYAKLTHIDSVIALDINPSVEISLNNFDRVVEAKALNSDGEKVLKGMDLKNVDMDVAINAIVGSLLKNGYISEVANSVLVSVKNDDEVKASEIEEKIIDEVEKILKASKINAAILSQMYDDNDDEIKRIAKENNISEGRAKLIAVLLKQKIKDTKGNEITEKDLAEMSINELNILMKSKNVKFDDMTSKGDVSDKGYIDEEKAIKIAYVKSKVSIADVKKTKVKLDYDKGIIVYEVDFKTDKMEYDYEINAVTGDVVDSEIEEIEKVSDDKEDDKDDDKDEDDKGNDEDDDEDDDDDKDNEKDNDDDKKISNTKKGVSTKAPIINKTSNKVIATSKTVIKQKTISKNSDEDDEDENDEDENESDDEEDNED